MLVSRLVSTFMAAKPKTVDEFLGNLNENQRAALEKLRNIQ